VLSAFPALLPQQHGADMVLTGFLDRSALNGVLAEIEALGLDLLELCQLPQAANHGPTTSARQPGPGPGRCRPWGAS
jgi:hypothetical protein